MSSLIRLVIIPLFLIILVLGAYSKITSYIKSVQIDSLKSEQAAFKMQKDYDDILLEIEALEFKSHKTKHDFQQIKHLEKTKLLLERYLPKKNPNNLPIISLLNMNLTIVENYTMFGIMAIAALLYLYKGYSQKKSYPIKPGLLKVRYREVPRGVIADKTYWQPMRSGGASIQTHSLIELNNKLLLKSSGQIKVFCLVFIFVGVNNMVFSLLKHMKKVGLETALDNPLAMAESFLSMGIIFIIAGGICLALFGSFNTTFDKTAGLLINKDISMPLNDIHALQIIEETCGGNDSRIFKSYEVNVVKNDGERLLLMDHGNYMAINADAEKLSEFLSVPIWEVG